MFVFDQNMTEHCVRNGVAALFVTCCFMFTEYGVIPRHGDPNQNICCDFVQNGVSLSWNMPRICYNVINFEAFRKSERLSTGIQRIHRKRNQADQNRPWVSHAGGAG